MSKIKSQEGTYLSNSLASQSNSSINTNYLISKSKKYSLIFDSNNSPSIDENNLNNNSGKNRMCNMTTINHQTFNPNIQDFANEEKRKANKSSLQSKDYMNIPRQIPSESQNRLDKSITKSKE